MIEKVKGLLKNKNNLIVLVLVGVLLMVIVLPVEEKNENSKLANIGDKINNTSSLTENVEVNQDLPTTDDYVTEMENKLETLLEQMEGAGEVEVIITLQSSEEKIVEKDEPINRSNTTEEDSQGGTRTVNNVDAAENTIYTTEGSLSVPYVVKTISPQVEGVVVLAQGAGNGSVSKNIADAVQVLFGIEAHQIKVIKMDT